MRKILIILIIIPVVAAAEDYLNYKFDLQQAKCITSVKPCNRFKKDNGTVVSIKKNIKSAVLKNGVKILQYPNGKKIISFTNGTKIIRDYDSTLTYISKKGKKRVISMDGKTPWGTSVKKHRRVLRRRNFIAEIIYSDFYSDDNMNKYTVKYYRELAAQVYRWMYNNRLPRYRLSILISNCRHCKTGFCRRKNIKEVAVIAYRNKKEYKVFHFKYTDLMTKNAFISLAKKTVSVLMN